MRIARITALLTIALASFVPATAHADSVTPSLPGPVDVVGGVAGGAINIADIVANCQRWPQRCVSRAR